MLPSPFRWLVDRRLDHIPGTDGWPVVGSTFELLADQAGFSRRMSERYGPVWRASTFLQRAITVTDPDLVHQVLRDRERVFSSEHGWAGIVGQFFPRGLMLRDFDEHRLHRGMLQPAFSKSALPGYLDAMAPLVERHVAGWGCRAPVPFHPRVRRLALEIAAVVFAGVAPCDDDVDAVGEAFEAMAVGSFSLLRLPLPGTAHGRAARGRRFLEDWLSARIPARRTAEGDDVLTRLCRATDADGRALSDREVVDHLIFLLQAAHDTTTSTITNLVWELGRSPAWQERLRAQLAAVPLAWDALATLGDVDLAIKETLRLHPPVTAIPRQALRDCRLGAYSVPARTTIWLDVAEVQRLPAFWTEPDRFDPDRFSDARAEHRRHPGIWFPYSAGPHVCLGLHFSVVEIKAVLHALLSRYRIELPEGYRPRTQRIPFPKPLDDLPVRLVPTQARGHRREATRPAVRDRRSTSLDLEFT